MQAVDGIQILIIIVHIFIHDFDNVLLWITLCLSSFSRCLISSRSLPPNICLHHIDLIVLRLWLKRSTFDVDALFMTCCYSSDLPFAVLSISHYLFLYMHQSLLQIQAKVYCSHSLIFLYRQTKVSGSPNLMQRNISPYHSLAFSIYSIHRSPAKIFKCRWATILAY